MQIIAVISLLPIILHLKILNNIPQLSKSDELLLGFLEWPLYFRVSGDDDIGYLGILRLTESLNNRNNEQNKKF